MLPRFEGLDDPGRLPRCEIDVLDAVRDGEEDVAGSDVGHSKMHAVRLRLGRIGRDCHRTDRSALRGRKVHPRIARLCEHRESAMKIGRRPSGRSFDGGRLEKRVLDGHGRIVGSEREHVSRAVPRAGGVVLFRNGRV